MSSVLIRVLRLLFLILARAFAGALVGIVLGFYVLVVTRDHFVQRDMFVHSVDFEEAQSQLGAIILLSSASACALLGPVVGAMRLGPWVGDAVYGLLFGVLCVACVALAIASFRHEQPFNHFKGAPNYCIDIARVYGVPIGGLVGALAGIAVGPLRRARKAAK